MWAKFVPPSSYGMGANVHIFDFQLFCQHISTFFFCAYKTCPAYYVNLFFSFFFFLINMYILGTFIASAALFNCLNLGIRLCLKQTKNIFFLNEIFFSRHSNVSSHLNNFQCHSHLYLPIYIFFPTINIFILSKNKFKTPFK